VVVDASFVFRLCPSVREPAREGCPGEGCVVARSALEERRDTQHTLYAVAVEAASAEDFSLIELYSGTAGRSDSGRFGGAGFDLDIDACAKRAFDLVVASLLLLVLSPMLLVVALLVQTTPGPVIFRQVRCGRGGRPFVCYKFRTMVSDAHERLQRDPHLRAAFAAGWKLHNDPRVTPVGRWMRKLSIDEVPQLVNVVRGEMSLVGPRPVQPDEFEQQYGPRGHVVFSIRPGITGLWQVSGRSAVDYSDRVALDLEYVQRRGFWYDLGLILKTIPAVIRGRGAV
jgi:lipopolysaccharide/colanic/teichoic acid biosynthesis glycosyltransferase